MNKPVLGAQLYTCSKFCQTLDGIKESLAKVKKIGYTAVQISGFGPVDKKEVAKLLADSGLTVAATHFDWTDFLNDTEGLIEIHKMYNCKHTAIGGLWGKYNSPEGLKQFLTELPAVWEKLNAAGLDFSYHNHNHELARLDGKKTYLELLYDLSDPKMLNAELDLYWIQAGGGNPVSWVKRCAGREPLIHYKDFGVTADGETRYKEIGEGNLEWAEIIQASIEGGVEYALIEQDNTYDRDPFESLAISYNYLRQMGLS